MCSDGYLQTLQRDWASYYGGQLTAVNQVLYDSVNNYIYIAGTTADSIGIATAGSDKESIGTLTPPIVPIDLLSWKNDLFLAKFDLDGNRIWGTYIGGDDQEMYPNICIDNEGNILVLGLTRSTSGIATTAPLKPISTMTVYSGS